MNAALAKPIPRVLVYCGAALLWPNQPCYRLKWLLRRVAGPFAWRGIFRGDLDGV